MVLQGDTNKIMTSFYNRNTDAATAILTVFSASIFGYGLVGILRSILVHRECNS